MNEKEYNAWVAAQVKKNGGQVINQVNFTTQFKANDQTFEVDYSDGAALHEVTPQRTIPLISTNGNQMSAADAVDIAFKTAK